MKRIAVLTDSASGYTLKEAAQDQIYMIPLQIIIDNKSYEDGIDISFDDLLEHLDNRKLLKTATPTLAKMINTVKQIKDDGYDHIIAIPLSSSLSSTSNYLRQAALENDIEIDIIETYTTMFIQKHIVKFVKACLDKNMSVKAILELSKLIVEQATTLILPSDLDYLKAGGRLTPAAASLAALLKIRPILALDIESAGKVDVIDKVRTDKKAMISMVKRLKKQYQNKTVDIYIAHSGDYDKAFVLQDLLIEAGFDKHAIVIDHLVAVIMAHTGRDCVGIQMIVK